MSTEGRSTDRRFWVMRGEHPDGPFDVRKLHEMLASGEVSWQTPACLHGEIQWQSLVKTPGLGPPAAPTINEAENSAALKKQRINGGNAPHSAQQTPVTDDSTVAIDVQLNHVIEPRNRQKDSDPSVNSPTNSDVTQNSSIWTRTKRVFCYIGLFIVLGKIFIPVFESDDSTKGVKGGKDKIVPYPVKWSLAKHRNIFNQNLFNQNLFNRGVPNFRFKAFNNVDVFYTSAITDDEIDNMERCLQTQSLRAEFKAMEVFKGDQKYIVHEFFEIGFQPDQKFVDNYKMKTVLYSCDVFARADVEIHLLHLQSNPNIPVLDTIRVIPMFRESPLVGNKKKSFENLELYYTSAISDAERDGAGKYLSPTCVALMKMQLDKTNKTYILRVVDRKHLELARMGDLSNEVFNGSPVQIYICDEMMMTSRMLDSTR